MQAGYTVYQKLKVFGRLSGTAVYKRGDFPFLSVHIQVLHEK